MKNYFLHNKIFLKPKKQFFIGCYLVLLWYTYPILPQFIKKQEVMDFTFLLSPMKLVFGCGPSGKNQDRHHHWRRPEGIWNIVQFTYMTGISNRNISLKTAIRKSAC